MTVMRCVVVGIGHVALQRYLPALAAEPDVELACVSRNPDSARVGAELVGGEALSDLAAAAAWKPDAVFVVTPDTQHLEVVRELIRLGAPRIHVEKPLVAAQGQTRIGARDLADGEQLAQEAAERGVELAVGYNYRQFATVLRAREEVTRRGWPAPTGVVASTHYACLSHVVDLIGVFGGDVAELTALRGPESHGEPKFHLEDRVVAFTFASGATGVLRMSSAEPRSDHLFDLRIGYPGGSVRIADLDGLLEVFDAREGHRLVLERTDERARTTEYEASFGKSIRAYLATVRGGEAPPATGADGIRELRFHAAVERSLEIGAPVPL
jgi:predicted dehydrogenase